jgi:ABC-type protease/lipase transport system fused ATPase/permease subunit
LNRSVRENIALADPGMPLDLVIEAAERAGAHEFMVGMPEGLRHMVGERGDTLSGGQCQCVAIARAAQQSAHPDLRRGAQRARLRKRASDPGQHGGDRPRPHG